MIRGRPPRVRPDRLPAGFSDPEVRARVFEVPDDFLVSERDEPLHRGPTTDAAIEDSDE